MDNLQNEEVKWSPFCFNFKWIISGRFFQSIPFAINGPFSKRAYLYTQVLVNFLLQQFKAFGNDSQNFQLFELPADMKENST